ncbi:dTDP-4-dehydrorhamnose 3,5-epimerase [archaeon]|nr:dTDP-4-dehydrorhamnose 3,5-epimerase [archaeon]
MKFIEMDLPGAFVIEPDVFHDNRGFFLESYNRKSFEDNGITAGFVQDNYSFSRHRGVIRGLHFQYPPHSQAKLVMVMSGKIFDVIVDLRKDSPAFRKWFGLELGSSPFRMIYVPRGFAHGFCTLEDDTHVIYKVDALYNPDSDGGIRWDDPGLDIPWPAEDPILSKKDSMLPFLSEISL